LTHFIPISGDVYHYASTSTNYEGGINSLSSDVYSVNDHMTDIVLEDGDEDINK